MLQAKTIQEVITRLDEIIHQCRQQQNRAGYFACLYRNMTIAVATGISEHKFSDAKRMEKLDVIFANRYINAWHAYNKQQNCSKSWKAAFDACTLNNLAVIQHLILGINTHINLDLAIAAAETCAGNDIFALQTDFDKINQIIASLTDEVYNKLCTIWFPLRYLGSITNNQQDSIINFSITKARRASWANAVALSSCVNDASKQNHVGLMDNGVVLLANRIIRPGRAISFMLTPVRMLEPKKTSVIMELLL